MDLTKEMWKKTFRLRASVLQSRTPAHRVVRDVPYREVCGDRPVRRLTYPALISLVRVID